MEFGEILSQLSPPITGPAWVSFATGKNPGAHGCYNFLLPRESLNEIDPITSEEIKGETFYEILEREGKKCILINLPCSSPPRIKGIIISDFLTPGENFTNQPALYNEIPELKKYRLIPNFIRQNWGEGEVYLQDARDLERIRFKIARRLFLKKDWDFFFVLFSLSDWVQHDRFANLIAGKEKSRSQAVKAFADLDRYLGWFVKKLPANTNLIIMSDHGFKAPTTYFYINKWLEKHGYLKIKAIKPGEGTVSLPLTPRMILAHRTKGWFLGAMKLIATLVIKSSRLYLWVGSFTRLLGRKAPSLKPKLPKGFFNIGLEPDLKKTMAYSLPGNVTGIYINDKKRFKNGIALPRDYHKIRDKIISQLKNLKSPLGELVFQDVFKKEEVYHGQALGRAPDVLYVENDSILISSELSPEEIFGSVPLGNGWHHLRGIFLAYGPDIKKGKKINRVRMIDLAPTILYFFNLPANEMEGRVLEEIFKRKDYQN